ANFAHVLEQVQDRTALEAVVVIQLGDMLGVPKGWLVNYVVKNIKKMVPPYHLPAAISFLSALAEGHDQDFHQYAVGPDDLAFLQYTGGTTGISKGAMLTHRNISANITQALTWLGSHADWGKEIIITALPLYH